MCSIFPLENICGSGIRVKEEVEGRGGRRGTRMRVSEGGRQKGKDKMEEGKGVGRGRRTGVRRIGRQEGEEIGQKEEDEREEE